MYDFKNMCPLRLHTLGIAQVLNITKKKTSIYSKNYISFFSRSILTDPNLRKNTFLAAWTKTGRREILYII